MLKPAATWTWLGWVVFFFAWGFVIHGVGLVLHEVGGHGLAAVIVGCGVDELNLSYFGHGFVRRTACPPRWLWRDFAIFSSAGLVVTISAGAVAMAFQRRAGLTPLGRLLLALLATHILIGQLWYATAGAYHEVQDPAAVAIMLDVVYNLHVLAWLPPLVLYAAAAVYGARAIVDAFRVCFGTRTRLDGLNEIGARRPTPGGASLMQRAPYGAAVAPSQSIVSRAATVPWGAAP